MSRLVRLSLFIICIISNSTNSRSIIWFCTIFNLFFLKHFKPHDDSAEILIYEIQILDTQLYPAGIIYEHLGVIRWSVNFHSIYQFLFLNFFVESINCWVVRRKLRTWGNQVARWVILRNVTRLWDLYEKCVYGAVSIRHI